ncbi:hypothetical protein ABPG73_011469 [Tetrahymena malaccensis]
MSQLIFTVSENTIEKKVDKESERKQLDIKLKEFTIVSQSEQLFLLYLFQQPCNYYDSSDLNQNYVWKIEVGMKLSTELNYSDQLSLDFLSRKKSIKIEYNCFYFSLQVQVNRLWKER